MVKCEANCGPRKKQSWVSLLSLESSVRGFWRALKSLHLRHFGDRKALASSPDWNQELRWVRGRKERHLRRALDQALQIFYSLSFYSHGCPPTFLVSREGERWWDGGRWVRLNNLKTWDSRWAGGTRLISSLLASFLHHFFCCVPTILIQKIKQSQQHGGEETRTPNRCPVSVLIGFWVSIECRRRSLSLPCDWGF